MDYSDYGTCENCGAGIKYKYYYNNKTYGSTCINKMLGIRVEHYGLTDVNKILRKIEEDTRTMEQRLQDEKDLYSPIAKRVFGSEYIGNIGAEVEIDVLITEHFWFEGNYGMSCCIKMVDKEYNQIVAFTTAKWTYDIENGDQIRIKGKVKDHNRICINKAFTINPEKYEETKISERTGNSYQIINYDEVEKDGHSLGSFPDHIAEDLGEEKNRGIYETDQTQLSYVKLLNRENR